MLLTETYLNKVEGQPSYANLEQFFIAVQRKAYTMAYMSVSHQHEALDIVQDAMEKMLRSYAKKPSHEWRALFFRVLHNQIVDWYRKNAIKNKLFFWQRAQEDVDMLEQVAATSEYAPEDQVTAEQSQQQILTVLKQLPIRQKQCFMLRQWQGLSTKETAEIMGCSEGCVKTHLHRAVKALEQAISQSNGDFI